MKHTQKILSILMALVMLVGIIPVLQFTVNAQPHVNTGNGYNGQAAAAYATKWAYGFNPYYSSFEGNGGDCANFVSQALFAGGLDMTSKWYSYQAINTKAAGGTGAQPGVSYAWIRANELYNYVHSNISNDVRRGDTIDNGSFAIGDLLFYDWNGDAKIDHCAIVTGADSSGMPKVAAHSAARDKYDWLFAEGKSTGSGWPNGTPVKSRIYLVKMHGTQSCVPHNRQSTEVWRANGALRFYTSKSLGSLDFSVSVMAPLYVNVVSREGDWGKVKVCSADRGRDYWGWVHLPYMSYQTTVTSEPTSHNFTSWGGRVNPTCITDGKETRNCTRAGCGLIENRTLPKSGHAPGAVATCTTAQFCNLCAAVLQEALGHDFVQTAYDPPNCTEPGQGADECARCSLTQVRGQSNWSTVNPLGTLDPEGRTITADRIESYQQTKRFTTGSAATLAGWERYDTNTIWGAWSVWDLWDPGQSATRDRQSQLWGYNLYACITQDPNSPFGRRVMSYTPETSWYSYRTSYGWNEAWGTKSIAEVNSTEKVNPGAQGGTNAGFKNIDNKVAYSFWDGFNNIPMFIMSNVNEFRYRDRVYQFWRWFDPGQGTQYTTTPTAGAGDPGALTQNLYRYTYSPLNHFPQPPSEGGTENWVITLEPTCTQWGLMEYNCLRGDHHEEEPIPPTGHNYQDFQTEPTCTTDGKVEHVCQNCGDELETDILDALGHEMHDDWYLINDDACQQEWRRDCHRDDCDYHELKYVNTDKHGYVVTEEVPPTCTLDGYQVQECTKCGKIHELTSDELGGDWLALGHDMGDFIIDKPWHIVEDHDHDLCMEQYGHRSCSRGDYDELIIEQKGHDFGTTEIPPLCLESGSIDKLCQDCEYVWEHEELEATDHEYSDWGHYPEVGDKYATCEEEGQRSRFCTNPWCSDDVHGHWEHEKIPALGHAVNDFDAYEETCLTDGSTENSYCARCKKVFVEQEKIPALGHDMGAWYTVTEPTYDANGVDKSDCQRCDYYEERETVKPRYTVTFVDYNDQELKVVTDVRLGESVTAPADPLRSNYKFIGWNKDFGNITGNLTVKALYEKINENLFIDDDTDVRIEVEDDTFDPGTEMIVKEVKPGDPGYGAATGWGGANGSAIHVVFDITFIDIFGNEVQPARSVKVYLPYPYEASVPSFNASWVVVHVNDVNATRLEQMRGLFYKQGNGNGTPVGWNDALREPKDYNYIQVVDGKHYFAFYADHFSIYAVAEELPDTPNTSNCGCCVKHNHNHGSNFWNQFICFFCRIWHMFLMLFGTIH